MHLTVLVNDQNNIDWKINTLDVLPLGFVMNEYA